MNYVTGTRDVADAQDVGRMPDLGNSPDAEARLSFRRAMEFLQAYRILLIGVFAAAVLFGITYVRFAEHKYTATMKIGPVLDTNQLIGGIDFSATTGSGLLSALSQPKVTPLATMKELLHSEPVARVLMRDPTIRDRFFPGLWDQEAKNWRRPQGMTVWLKSGFKSMLGLPAWVPPNPGLLQQALVSALEVEDDRETGFTTLAYKDRDPRFAEHLLSAAATAADAILRQRTRSEATRRIAFISKRLDTDSQLSVDHRAVLIRFLANEEQKLIGVAAGTPMAADIILPAKSSAQVTSPNWKAVLVASAIFGIFLALACAVLLPARLVPRPRQWIVLPLFAVGGIFLGAVTAFLAG